MQLRFPCLGNPIKEAHFEVTWMLCPHNCVISHSCTHIGCSCRHDDCNEQYRVQAFKWFPNREKTTEETEHVHGQQGKVELALGYHPDVAGCHSRPQLRAAFKTWLSTEAWEAWLQVLSYKTTQRKASISNSEGKNLIVPSYGDPEGLDAVGSAHSTRNL